MRSRDYYWSLFHTPEKRQLNDLRTDQIESIFEALPEKHKQEWLIWREGFRSWKPFTEFPQLLVSLRRVNQTGPVVNDHQPPIPPTVEHSEAPAVGTAVATAVNTQSGSSSAKSEKVTTLTQSISPGNTASMNKSMKASNTKTQAATESEPVVQVAKSQVDGLPAAEHKFEATPTDFSQAVEASMARIKAQLSPQSKAIEQSVKLAPTESRTTVSDRLARVKGEDVNLALEEDEVEDREGMRVPKKLDLRIFIGDQVFSNSTIDLSLKGLRLRDPLPAGLPHYFNVEVIVGPSFIPLICSVSENAAGSVPNPRLKIEVNNFVNALKTVMLAS